MASGVFSSAVLAGILAWWKLRVTVPGPYYMCGISNNAGALWKEESSLTREKSGRSQTLYRRYLHRAESLVYRQPQENMHAPRREGKAKYSQLQNKSPGLTADDPLF